MIAEFPKFYCVAEFNPNIGVFQEISPRHEGRFLDYKELTSGRLYMGVYGCGESTDRCLYGIEGFYAVNGEGDIITYKNKLYDPGHDNRMQKLYEELGDWYEVLEMMNL